MSVINNISLILNAQMALGLNVKRPNDFAPISQNVKRPNDIIQMTLGQMTYTKMTLGTIVNRQNINCPNNIGQK
jgi:hypothetical protein